MAMLSTAQASEYVGIDGYTGGNIGIYNKDRLYTTEEITDVHNQINQATNGKINITPSTLRNGFDDYPRPDDVTGYKGNIAIIGKDFYPANFSGFAQNWDINDEPCQHVHDLTKGVRGVSPGSCNGKISYGIIWINTGTVLWNVGGRRLRVHLLLHELMHHLGYSHETRALCQIYKPQLSVMCPSAYAGVAGYFDDELSVTDLNKLGSIYGN